MKRFHGAADNRRIAMWAVAACSSATIMAIPTVIALAAHPAFSAMSVVRVTLGGVIALASCGVLFWLLYRAPRRRLDPEVIDELMRLERDSAQRIADQLHDTAVQSLVVATYLARSSGADNEAVDTLTDQLRTVEREVRDIIFHAREPSIAEKDLGRCAAHLSTLLDLRDGLRIHWDWPADPETTLATGPAVLAYRFLDETLSNVAQHAGTSDAYVTLSVTGDQLVVSVHDEGRGFNAAGRPTKGRSTGLQLLQGRAGLLDATVTVASSPGRGTTATLRASLPTDGHKPVRLGRAPRALPDDADPPPVRRPLIPAQLTPANRQHVVTASRPTAREHARAFRLTRRAPNRESVH